MGGFDGMSSKCRIVVFFRALNLKNFSFGNGVDKKGRARIKQHTIEYWRMKHRKLAA
jgi:hypothetical protein